MIGLGKDIVSLREIYGKPWSRYAFLFKMPDRGILLHALSSQTIECDDEALKDLRFAALPQEHQEVLLDAKLALSRPEQDDEILSQVKQKIEDSLGEMSISTLFLIVTSSCNLACVYCYENLGECEPQPPMTLADMISSVDRFMLGKAEKKTIFFYGGEPLICWDNIKKCIQHARDAYGESADIQIITNGTLQREDLVPFLREHSVGIGISIDGPEHITNRTRLAKSTGVNVFSLAMGLFRDCEAAGLDASVLCTVSTANASEIETIVDFFLAEKIKSLTFNLQLRQFGCAIEEDLPFWDDLGIKMAAAYKKLLDSGVVESRSLRYLSGLVESTFTISECDAGYSTQVVVRPDGKVGPCQGFLSDEKYWVKADDYSQMRDHQLWRTFASNNTLQIGACEDCPVNGTCGGGCHYNRIKMAVPNPNFCQYMRSFMFHVLKICF